MELTFELHVRRECYNRVRGKLIRDSERDQRIPHEPPYFRRTRGTYKAVSDEANRLNEMQRKSGYLDYMFFPEVADTARV